MYTINSFEGCSPEDIKRLLTEAVESSEMDVHDAVEVANNLGVEVQVTLR